MKQIEHKTIDKDKLQKLQFLYRKRLIEDNALNKIDKNIVDIDKLKCTAYCFEKKDFFPKYNEHGAVKETSRDTKMLNHRKELKPIIQKALNEWNYWLSLKRTIYRKWKDEDGEIHYEVTKGNAKYKLSDLVDIKLIRGENLNILGLENKLMIGMVTMDGKKMRYLIDGNII